MNRKFRMDILTQLGGNMGKLITLGTLALLLTAPPTFSQIGMKHRIGWSADGNLHDPDDWGATPWSLAIAWAFGRNVAIVHYDYSNHIVASDPKREAEMTESALGGAERFLADKSKFFDDMKNLNGAIANFKKEAEKSTENDQFISIQAGPMEVAYRCLVAVEESKRKYITFVSHSNWNNDHVHAGGMTRTWADLKKVPGGAKFISISDQNARLGTGSAGKWNELKNMGPKFQWMLSRQERKPGDVSDAGMMWYALTGAQNASPEDIIKKLKNPDPQGVTTGIGNLHTITSGSRTGFLNHVHSGNYLMVKLPFSGRFNGITLAEMTGRRHTFVNASQRLDWIEVPNLDLANGPYIITVDDTEGISHTVGKLTVKK